MMKAKHFFLLSGTIILGVTSCEEKKEGSTSTSALATKGDSVSYAIGLNIGESLKKDDLSEMSADLIASGIKAAFKQDSALMQSEKAMGVIQQFMQERNRSKGAEGMEKGKKFLEENAKNQGVVTLPSGLQYQVITEGKGAKPTAADKVSVHYTGTFLDGNVFDSSVQRGEPAQFMLNQVIPGWTEALQLMPVGSTWKLWIPSNLAYGEQGRPGAIGPNEMLTFELELLSIEK